MILHTGYSAFIDLHLNPWRFLENARPQRLPQHHSNAMWLYCRVTSCLFYISGGCAYVSIQTIDHTGLDLLHLFECSKKRSQSSWRNSVFEVKNIIFFYNLMAFLLYLLTSFDTFFVRLNCLCFLLKKYTSLWSDCYFV